MTEGVIQVGLLTTGGTIEKTYDEAAGSLRNAGSTLQDILRWMRLPSLRTRHVPVMSKDSLDLDDHDRGLILEAVRQSLALDDAVLVLHGTDTLAVTGEVLCARLGEPSKPVILTGAMRPHEFRDTDSYQNMAEALLACRLLSPGVYVVMHNRALRFPGVYKDRARGVFERAPR